jgi:phasin family protein
MALMLRCSKRVGNSFDGARQVKDGRCRRPGGTIMSGSKSKAIEAPAMIEDQTAQATARGFETTMSGLKDGMTRAASGFADTQAKVREGMEKAMKTAEELVAFGQGNFEAVVKSGQIWTAGVQDIGKQMAANAQASFDETMSTFKAMSSIKSLKDAFDLQASLARSTLEKTLTESGKLTDASVKLTEQTLAPLSARFSLAMEKFGKAG